MCVLKSQSLIHCNLAKANGDTTVFELNLEFKDIAISLMLNKSACILVT